jgi:hypothetical protein
MPSVSPSRKRSSQCVGLLMKLPTSQTATIPTKTNERIWSGWMQGRAAGAKPGLFGGLGRHESG